MDDQQKKILRRPPNHLYNKNPQIRAHSRRLKTIDEIDRQEGNTRSMLKALSLEVGADYNCCICLYPAINSMKCTPKAVVSPEGDVPKQ